MSGIWIGLAAIAGIAIGLPIVVLAIVIASIHWTFRFWSGFLAIALVVAALIGTVRGLQFFHEDSVSQLESATAYRGRVDGRPRVRGSSQSFLLEIEQLRINDTWVDGKGSIDIQTAPVPRVFVGDHLRVFGTAVLAQNLDRDQYAYLRAIHADASLFTRQLTIEKPGRGIGYNVQRFSVGLSERLQAAVPGDTGILLAGLVMGDDTRLSPERRRAFVNTGTTHITAVSGSNFALLVVILSWIGRNTANRRRLWFQIGAVVLIWGYAAIVGFGPPAVRAALVASFALFAVRFGRQADFVTLIVLAAALDAIVRPTDVGQLSYQLSTVSALALALVLPGLHPRGVSQTVAAAMLSTFAAQLATLPFLVLVYPRISLSSILANALIAGPTSLAFLLATIASVFLPIWPFAGTAIASVAALFSEAVIRIVETLGSDRWVIVLPELWGGEVLWITLWSALGIALLSRDVRIVARSVVAEIPVYRQNIAFAVIGSFVGTILGILIWFFH